MLVAVLFLFFFLFLFSFFPVLLLLLPTSMHVICTLNHGLDCLYGRLLALASAADTSVPAGVSF